VKTLADFDFSFQPSVKRSRSKACTHSASSSARRMSSCSDRPAWARPTSP
jgi:hypothetical protein